MKERLPVIPMKILAALCLFFGMAPVFLLIGRLAAENEPLLWMLLPAASFLWGCCIFLMPGKGRMPFAILGCLLLLLYGFVFLLPGGVKRLSLLLPCMGFLLALPPAWGRPVWSEWPAGAWLGGVAAHLFGQFVSSWPMFEGILPYLLPPFAVYAFLFLMSLNRQSLRDGMHDAGKAPLAIRRRNIALVTVLFLICFAASCWKRLAVWAGIAWDAIRNAIVAVVAFLMSLLPGQSMQGGGSGGGDLGGMFGAEEAEPGLVAVILEKVFQVLALLALIALLVLFVRAVVRGVGRLWKRLMERLRQYAADSGEDYIDEVESTMNWDERTQTLRNTLKRTFRREKNVPWESLTGRQRVRRLYQQFLRRRPEEKTKTAREALKADKSYSQNQALAFADLYERARYSDLDVSDQEADDLRRKIKG